MRPFRHAVAILATVCAASAAVFAAAAGVASASNQPPQLQALETQMSELTVNSERMTGRVTVSGHLPRKLRTLRQITLSFSGEESNSPQLARFTVTAVGHEVTVLQVGETAYLHEPSLAARDGGRPWVVLHISGGTSPLGSTPGLSSGSGWAISSPAKPFANTAKLLAASSDVRSLGASTVDGQPVIGYAGTLPFASLAKGLLPKKTLARLHGNHLRLAGAFEVFANSAGVPVSTHLLLSIGKVRLLTSADVLATNFTMSAPTPPPASETISEAEAERIERAGKKKP